MEKDSQTKNVQSSYPTAKIYCRACGDEIAQNFGWYRKVVHYNKDGWQDMDDPYCYVCVQSSSTRNEQ